MAFTPSTVMGYGAVATKYVFRLVFSYPLSSAVKYECYDNDEVYPAVSSVDTTDNEVFGHATGSSLSMIALHDTTDGKPGAANWLPSNTRSNTGSMNRMKGLTYYVTQQGSNVAAGGSIHWNMQCVIPATTKTSDAMGFDLLVRYTFTSTTPVLTWKYKRSTSGAVTIITPGTHGIIHCRNGITTSPYLANIPVTGTERTEDAWVTESL